MREDAEDLLPELIAWFRSARPDLPRHVTVSDAERVLVRFLEESGWGSAGARLGRASARCTP